MTDEGAVGRHVIAEMWGARNLERAEDTREALERAVRAGNLTLINLTVHQFSPMGATGVAVLAESHLSVHTWPERGFAAIDFFTCGESANVEAILPAMSSVFEPEWIDVRELTRGRPDGVRLRGRYEEDLALGPMAPVYRVDRVLDERATAYQRADVFESAGVGKVLALDGVVQHTDLDTWVYHEMLCHPAMHAHPDPRRVAVVGGGDVHLVAECLAHDTVEQVLLLELDSELIELCAKHFPAARAALRDPRVEVIAGDAFETVGDLQGSLDVIMVDLTDPMGPAARLFEQPFYALCHRALGETGFVVAQTESIHFHADTVRNCMAAMGGAGFDQVDLLWGAMATYPGAFWTFTVGAKGLDPRVVRRTQPGLASRLYKADAHAWYFLPESVRESLLSPR